jgi:hypothetical protein
MRLARTRSTLELRRVFMVARSARRRIKQRGVSRPDLVAPVLASCHRVALHLSVPATIIRG